MKNHNDITAYLVKQGQAGKLTAETVNRISSGEIYLRDNQIELRREITVAGGKIPLLESGDDKLVGLNGFNGNKLNDFLNQVITAIKFGYATQASSGVLKPEDFAYDAALPGVIRSAKLNVLQNDKPVVSLPIAALVAKGTATKVGDDFRELNSFALLVEGEPIDVEIEFPKGAAITGTAKHYVEVLFDGSITAKRA